MVRIPGDFNALRNNRLTVSLRNVIGDVQIGDSVEVYDEDLVATGTVVHIREGFTGVQIAYLNIDLESFQDAS